MDILIPNIDPALEAALGRSNDENNANSGQNLRLEEFLEREVLDLLNRRHLSFWKLRDAEAITSKLDRVADKLTAQDIAAIDAIVAEHTPVVVIDEEQPIEEPVIP